MCSILEKEYVKIGKFRRCKFSTFDFLFPSKKPNKIPNKSIKRLSFPVQVAKWRQQQSGGFLEKFKRPNRSLMVTGKPVSHPLKNLVQEVANKRKRGFNSSPSLNLFTV